MKLTQTQQARIQKFSDLCQQGIDAWTEAGTIIVSLVEEDPSVFDKIIEMDPRMNAGILGRFEAMGRGVLHPHLLLNDSPGYEKLAQMPYSVQERFLNEPIPLIVETPSGTDTLLVAAKDMTPAQARQAFGKGRIKTAGEQKAWIMDQKAKKARPVGSNVSPWVIKGGRVEFREGATLSAGEIATILTQITR
jgi:hypothetical protein